MRQEAKDGHFEDALYLHYHDRKTEFLEEKNEQEVNFLLLYKSSTCKSIEACNQK